MGNIKRLIKKISKKSNKLIDKGKKKTKDSMNVTKEKTESTVVRATGLFNKHKNNIVREVEKV